MGSLKAAIDMSSKDGFESEIVVGLTKLFVGLFLRLFLRLFTGSFKVAGILGLGSIIPLFFYYFHERIWNKIKWGTDLNKE